MEVFCQVKFSYSEHAQAANALSENSLVTASGFIGVRRDFDIVKVQLSDLGIAIQTRA